MMSLLCDFDSSSLCGSDSRLTSSFLPLIGLDEIVHFSLIHDGPESQRKWTGEANKIVGTSDHKQFEARGHIYISFKPCNLTLSTRVNQFIFKQTVLECIPLLFLTCPHTNSRSSQSLFFPIPHHVLLVPLPQSLRFFSSPPPVQ